MTSEKDLLRRAHSFDPAALAEIYDTYSPGLFRYSIRLLGERNLAEECVAETMSRFLNAIKNSGGPKEHLQAYLYRIAHNYITDLYRRKPDWEQELTELEKDDSRSPVETVQSSQEQTKIRQALRSLTPDQRQVIVLKFLEGYNNQSVARTIGKPVSAVKSLQHRALVALRRILKDELDTR